MKLLITAFLAVALTVFTICWYRAHKAFWQYMEDDLKEYMKIQKENKKYE
jgi:hypothetical protein